MRTAPIKPQYGPTLPQLLAPRWRASRLLRRATAAAGALLVAIVVGIVLLTWPKSVSHGGATPFRFDYADHLRRVTAPRGSLAKVEGRSNGLLVASLTVGPVRIPPYSGDLEGELPLYADSVIAQLAAAEQGFDLELEGKIRDNDVPGYTIDFSAQRRGRPIFGRVVLLFPDRPHRRDGVLITMLQRPSKAVTSPDRIGVVGDLKLPFTTFQTG